MKKQQPRHAIITGDIVASRKIMPDIRKELYDNLSLFLKSLTKDKWLLSYQTFRGDSIQCDVMSIQQSLRVALMIKSFVMSYIPEERKKLLRDVHPKRPILTKGYFNIGYDIRLAVGIGEVDFIGKGKLAASDGPAFQLSGLTLDRLKEQNTLLALKTGDAKLNEELDVIVSLLDALTQKWTQNQAELILYKLKQKKDEEISSILKISLSAVNQRKKNAQWTAIEKAVQFFETKIDL